MMRVDTPFRIMRILFSWAPASFVEKHVEKKSVISHVKICELMIKIWAVQETCWDKVILDTFVLETLVNDLNVL